MATKPICFRSNKSARACRSSKVFSARSTQTYPDAPEKLQFNEALKRVFNRLAGDLITNTQARVKQASLKHRLMFGRIKSVWPHSVPQSKQNCKRIKAFLYENLYYSPSLAGEKDDAERVVTELFAFWMKESQPCRTTMTRKRNRNRCRAWVCDYIAGMTDHYIIEQYEKYCGGK